MLHASQHGDLKQCFRTATRLPGDSVVEAWRRETREEAQPLLGVTRGPADYGRAVIQAARGGGQYNIAPVLSPDGSQLVFLSSRDLFSIDMYLADTRTGKITKRIVRTDVNPHFESRRRGRHDA